MIPDLGAIINRIYRHIRALRRFLLAIIVASSMIMSFLLRFEFAIPADKLPILFKGVLLAVAVKLPIYYWRRLDRGGWRYVEFSDLKAHCLGNLVASALFVPLAYILIGSGFPRSIYMTDFVLCLMTIIVVLFTVRLHGEPPVPNGVPAGAKKILIYGAGTAGRSLLREAQARPGLGYHVLGFLDDDPSKKGMLYLGVAVIGKGREAAGILKTLRRQGKNVDEIVIAIPSASPRKMADAVANCRAASVQCRTVPSLGELLTGKVLTTQVRDVSYTDLLGREPVRLDTAKIRRATFQKRILVTGGGGSIGSELCRQLADFGPAALLVLEQAESDLFRIHRELVEQYPAVSVVPVIGSIRSYQRVMEILRTHKVDTIFHAAAYKHVPMMEIHPIEAAENNVLGTHNLLQSALACRVSSFVMISSDKAVNPTNIMGLSKRVAELLVASMPQSRNGCGTRFVSVRFGNVLGSNGSVVPVFREQIAAGGPVTVTHPEMRRYFMTIPEAVHLVLEASQLGAGAEIFVLDMGEPVKVLDLAQNMIRLSGRKLEEIEIRFTGTRPGEKLFEELRTNGEDTMPTPHPKIKIYCGPTFSRDTMRVWVEDLERLIADRDEAAVVGHMAAIVPEYTASEQWRSAVRERSRAACAD